MANRIVRRSFGGFRGSRGARRQTEWLASANINVVTSIGAATFLLDQSLTAAELAKRPFTVTRTIGSLWVQSDQNAAFENFVGALGMMVVSDKAVTTGATAVPDPITQESSDEWFMYQAFAGTAGAEASAGAFRMLQEYKFDSRAQRKVQDGEDIAVVIANASAAFGMQFMLKFRLLIKVA